MHFVTASEEHSQLMLQWLFFMLEMLSRLSTTLTSSIKTVNKTDALNV